MCAKLALSLSAGTISPSVFGPITRRRCGRAASSIACFSPFAPVGPAVSTAASLQPRAPRSAMMPGTVSAGVATTARSGTVGRSAARATQSSPITRPCLGFTGRTGPSKPPLRMLAITTAPTEPARSEAPKTATECGCRANSRLRMVKRYPSGDRAAVWPASPA